MAKSRNGKETFQGSWSAAGSVRPVQETTGGAQPETLSRFSPGELFADYTLRQFCGRGAYGEVYLAEDLSGKTVAIKIIPITPGDETWHLELIGLRYFRQNVDIHPSLVNIYHVGETENCFYYTMEPADNLASQSGEYLPDTLAERIARGPLPPRKILQVAHAMLNALETLNRHRLMHRDLKPANILFVKGNPKLSDVGLMTRMDGEIGRYGTMDYLPPEIVSGQASGTAGNDLYALGKVLYCCLTGLPASSYPEIPVSIRYSVWRQLRPVIQQACSEKPSERFYSPADFRAELPRVLHPPRWYDLVFEVIRRQKETYPRIFRVSLSLLLLLLSTLSLFFAIFWHTVYQHRQTAIRRTEYIFAVIRELNDRHLHLARCAEASGRRSQLRSMEQLADMAIAARLADHPEQAEALCRQVEQRIRLFGEADLAKLMQDFPPPQEPETCPLSLLHHTLDAYLQFRETPGFRQLSEKDAIPVNLQIYTLQNVLTRRYFGPIPGRDYFPESDLQLRMVYVSPGLLSQEPQQAYWIGANELTIHTCARLTGEIKWHGKSPLRPATGLCWNDAIMIAALLTERAQAQGTLPEGCIYRLPTLAEWQFAARGGWRAPSSGGDPRFTDFTRFAWVAANSDCHVHPVRKLAPNPLGLYDVFGNVAELASESLFPGAPCFGMGGDFRTRSFQQAELCHYDKGGELPGWCGIRLVLAPGEQTYFEQQWYQGGKRIKLQNGNRFELLGGGSTALTGSKAREWAAMLGGRLAVLKTQDALQRHAASSNQLTRQRCWIGGATGSAGKWYWNDGTPITNGIWLESAAPDLEQQFLQLDGEFWRAVPATPESRASLLLVEWPGAVRQEPVIAPDFSRPPFAGEQRIGEKRIVLLTGQADWYTYKRVAELLQARLWAPTSQTELQEAAKFFTGHAAERLALGGRHTLQGWFWLDGRIMDAEETVPDEESAGGVNQRFAALCQGRLCTTDHFDGALLEISASR